MAGPQQLTPLQELNAQVQQLVSSYVVAQGVTREATVAAASSLDVVRTIITNPQWIKQMKQAHGAQAKQSGGNTRPSGRKRKHP